MSGLRITDCSGVARGRQYVATSPCRVHRTRAMSCQGLFVEGVSVLSLTPHRRRQPNYQNLFLFNFRPGLIPKRVCLPSARFSQNKPFIHNAHRRP